MTATAKPRDRKEQARSSLISIMAIICPPGYELQTQLNDDPGNTCALGHFVPTWQPGDRSRVISFFYAIDGRVEQVSAIALKPMNGGWVKDKTFGTEGTVRINVTTTSLASALCDVATQTATHPAVVPFLWERDSYDPQKMRLLLAGKAVSCIWQVGKHWGTLHGMSYASKEEAKRATEAVEAFVLRSALAEKLSHTSSQEDLEMLAA